MTTTMNTKDTTINALLNQILEDAQAIAAATKVETGDQHPVAP